MTEDGTDPTDGADCPDLASLATRRRDLIATIGTAGAAAVAGCLGDSGGSGATATSTQTDAETDTMTQSTQTADEPEIGSRFGYVGTSSDEEPPVEPDHTINLEFTFVEGRGDLPEFYFEPTGLAIEPGDTVKFNVATPHHNVNAFHPAFGYTQRVPDGVPPFSSPILAAGDYWLYTFEEEGVHDFTCAPHEVFGMSGRIVVGEASGPGANPIGEAPGGEEARPPEYTSGLVLSDEALAPENIQEQGSVSWDEIAQENKRLLLEPVEE
ncbi:cupredoxin domain-containing protein [Halomicrobium urmianum]|uniref:cupredoxin domain-containing protein n=1 Tax=Halomicrobium urmianum TaxID=1586233 RepID=UPI001CD977E9|nr:plastocyanin/azurin family copper-binding protein [Halomicrobium urmianum]